MKIKNCPICGGKARLEGTAIKCSCGYAIAWTGENAQEKVVRDWNGQKGGNMVNVKLLKETIVLRGVKISHVARELGITYVSMNNKLKGKHEITLTEALEMKKILRLTQDEWNEIFDAE